MFDKIQQNDSVVVLYYNNMVVGSYKAFKKVEEVGDEINDELYNIHLECDVIDIYIQHERLFHVIVKNKGSLLCCTLGQLRMFLTLCGLGDFVKQLKS